MASEIEQGDLANFIAEAAAFHQAMSEVALARCGIAGLRGAYEHAPEHNAKSGPKFIRSTRLWHYVSRKKSQHNKINRLGIANAPKWLNYDFGVQRWAKSDITQNFYAMVQNKFHYAITGQTAAEIIHSKVDHNAPYAGLLTWKNAPHSRILASDVTVAKNYLTEPEIKRLERTISSFFDYIENIIENREQMTMADMVASVDKFLTFNEFKVLTNRGRISKTQADQKALAEYAEFNRTQKIESDFDKVLKATKALGNEAKKPTRRSRKKTEE